MDVVVSVICLGLYIFRTWRTQGSIRTCRVRQPLILEPAETHPYINEWAVHSWEKSSIEVQKGHQVIVYCWNTLFLLVSQHILVGNGDGDTIPTALHTVVKSTTFEFWSRHGVLCVLMCLVMLILQHGKKRKHTHIHRFTSVCAVGLQASWFSWFLAWVLFNKWPAGHLHIW